jgi:hypothetical protein
VLRPGSAGGRAQTSGDFIDLDAHLTAVDNDSLAVLLRNKKSARGAILAAPEAARQAAACGVKTIVTEPVLPALLSILSAEQ